MSILLALLGQFWPYLVIIGGGLVWGMKQRRAGAASERAKQAAADARVRDIAEDVQSDIGSMSPEQIDAELRKRARR